jgi:hypothetical protein
LLNLEPKPEAQLVQPVSLLIVALGFKSTVALACARAMVDRLKYGQFLAEARHRSSERRRAAR